MSYYKSDYLYHHGILGQRWGKRNGPPYPLDAEDHSASEKKAGWKKSLDKDESNSPTSSKRETRREKKLKRNAEIAKEYADKAVEQRRQLVDLTANGLKSETMRKKYGKGLDMNDAAFYLYFGKTKKIALQDAINERNLKIRTYEKASKDKAAGKLTDSQKMLIGATAVAVAFGTAYFGYRYAKSKGLRLDSLFEKKVKAGEKISKDLFMKKWDKQQTRIFNAISQDAFDHLSTDDIKIDAGNILRRVSKSDGSIIRGANQYVSFTDEDVERYKAILPTQFWKQWGLSNKEGFVASYQAVSDIVSPSAKKRVQAFIDLLGEDVIDSKTGSVKSGRDYVLNLINNNSLYISYMSDDDNYRVLSRDTTSMTNEELGRRAYQIFASLQLNKDKEPLTAAYVDKLKRMGYNAIVDDNDAGRLSDMPLIIFDAAQNLSWVGADKLSVQGIADAGNNLVELLNRKR